MNEENIILKKEKDDGNKFYVPKIHTDTILLVLERVNGGGG